MTTDYYFPFFGDGTDNLVKENVVKIQPFKNRDV